MEDGDGDGDVDEQEYLRIPRLTRALSSTKPSARCTALATWFISCMQKRVQLKGWGQGETGPMRLMLLA